MIDFFLGGIVVASIATCVVIARRELRHIERERELREKKAQEWIDRTLMHWDAAFEERHKKGKSG